MTFFINYIAWCALLFSLIEQILISLFQNYLRKGLNRDRYASEEGLDDQHLSHCVDSIRQSLMCNADTSVNVWQWTKTYRNVIGRVNVAHSCRNFEKIKQWALDHRMHQWIDMEEFIEDDLDIPVIYSSHPS